MDTISPVGPVYQAGTLSGNPLAMAAGAATMRQLSQPGFYAALEEKSARFAKSLTELAEKYLPGQTTLNRVGSMMTAFFTSGPVVDFDSAMQSDTARYGQHFRQMQAQGIWLAPSQFEALFISAAQSEAELAMALEKTECSFKKLAK
jgi:glutamate-1-semialdehyde 2,1-aminomutase